MTKIEEFKSFVKKNPILVNYVKENKMSWQNFYELYDIYGEDNNIWNEYLKKEEVKQNNINKSNNITFNSVMDMVKNIDANKLQDNLTSIQKAIDLFGGMLTKNEPSTNDYKPRPIYRRLDD